MLKKSEWKKFKLDFSNFSVKDKDGKNYWFSVVNENDSFKLKIGDPDILVVGIYTLRYKL